MKILDNRIVMHIESPIGGNDNADILLGVHLIEGQYEECSEPIVGMQLGFLFFTITIIITKWKRSY